MSLGKHLRRERLRCGLTLEGLARKVGYSKMHLWRIEKGRQQPGFDFVQKCATALGITLDTLVGSRKRNGSAA